MLIVNITKIMFLTLIVTLSVEIASASDNNAHRTMLDEFALLPKNEWGVRADSPALDRFIALLDPPHKSKNGQLLTVNRMGFDIFQPVEPEQNWLIQDFTEAGTKATKPVLDIGTGYGNMVFKILPNASTVIINDIAVEHLLSVRQFASIKPEHLKKLYLNHNAFPEETSFPTSSLSIVILDGVLPFLDGYQIEAGFRKIANWLEPGGKIYIISTSPTHPQISEWYLPIYVQKWREGNKWPGMHLDVAKAFPDQLYNLPPYIHVMDEKPLIYALKKAGFYIEKSGYIKRDYGNSSSQNDKDNIGIIAVRKKKTLF